MTCKDCIHFEMCNELDEKNGIQKAGATRCGFFKEKSLFVQLPYPIGTHLWRVTYPYRKEPKVTEYVVKNFRTIGKKHTLQIEVQALNVPGTNWMRPKDFHETRGAAQAELMVLQNTPEKEKLYRLHVMGEFPQEEQT